jgi:hypothetical protein
MKTIQINYDLRGPHRDYEKLYDYIRGISGNWARPLMSLWLVRTTKTPGMVRDEIGDYVDSNDEVLVLDVTDDNWASNFKDDHTGWMHQNMSSVRRAA